MKLDRYPDGEPKFRVLRRQGDPRAEYVEMPAYDYFVIKLNDKFAAAALFAYAAAAASVGECETSAEVHRLALEALQRNDAKIPD